jgi:glycine/D-amino acid oxidase-like deaminating enzyme
MLAFMPLPVQYVYQTSFSPLFGYPLQSGISDYDIILAQAAREEASLRNAGHAYQHYPLALLDDIALAELAAQSHRMRARREQEEAVRRRRQQEREHYIYALHVRRQKAIDQAAWARQQQVQRLAAEAKAREHERLRRQEIVSREEAELSQLEVEMLRFIQALQAPTHHLERSGRMVSPFSFQHSPSILTRSH